MPKEWVFIAILFTLIGIRIGARMFASALGRAEARGQLRRARGASRIRWF